MKVDFIIDGAAAPAASGATYARHDPVTGAVASEAAAASEADVAKVVEVGGAGVSRLVADRPRRTARASAQGRRSLEARADEFAKPMIEEIGATGAVGGLQCPLRRQHAARSRGADHADHWARSSPPTSRA